MPSDVGFMKPREALKADSVVMGNGVDVGVIKLAQLPGIVCNKEGRELQEATLDEVTHLPGAKFNLFSLSRMTRIIGWKIDGDKEAIWIKKDGMHVQFDIVIPTPKGALYCMYFKRTSEMAMSATDQGTKLSIMKAHNLLRHCSEDMTRMAAKKMGWILSGTWKPCEACAAGKAKQKNVPIESKHKPATKGENRIFIDIAMDKRTKESPNMTKPNWCIMVDERTGMKFSDFYETKNGMIELTCAQWNKWKSAGLAVKFVRLDNAGENKKLKERSGSSDWKLNIE
jgi:hypothetical protein